MIFGLPLFYKKTFIATLLIRGRTGLFYSFHFRDSPHEPATGPYA